MRLAEIRQRLGGLGNPRDAEFAGRYFKTGPGQYGAGDRFRGIRVPVLRALCRECGEPPLPEILELLKSPHHEDRLLALLILVRLFGRGDEKTRARIFSRYLKHTRYINNWDLVDTSAPHIVGAFLMDKDRAPLYRLVRSKSLWERRISVMATQYFIKGGDFRDTLKIARLLIADPEDLIHKAVGWMLREVGNRDRKAEEGFLRDWSGKMPRVMLRYAIEKFPPERRRFFLQGV